MLHVTGLRTEYKVNPIGMDEKAPRFSYRLEGSSRYQTERRITVRSEHGEIVWDTGFVQSGDTAQITYLGKPFLPFTRYFWSVEVKDENSELSPASEEAFFETGFFGKEWQSDWISANPCDTYDAMTEVHRLFSEFKLEKKVVKARLYSTALGMYEPYLNGKPVTDDVFNPGWTDYYTRVQYQAYDVTGFLQPGMNEFAVFLGSGWFSGRIAGGWHYGTSECGRHAIFRAELHLEFEDGTGQVIPTGKDFRFIYQNGSLLMSDIYMGETCESRTEDRSWMLPVNPENSAEMTNPTDPSAPQKNRPYQCCPVFIEHPGVKITWHSGPKTRRVGEIVPVKITKLPSGGYLVDFGQNFAGRERLYMKNTFGGQTITVRHGEMLQADGSLYEANLRKATAVTTYICDTAESAVYEPKFTFYGFRYAEISGWNGELTADNIRGIVLSSDLPRTGNFSCSQPLIDQLYSNIIWGQKSNFVDVPTDCPQRDERYGWTGDTQVFCNMATWNSFAADFYTKWIIDLNSNRLDTGCYGHYSPCPYAGNPTAYEAAKDFQPFTRYGSGGTGWADAGIICPWILYLKYADTRLIRKYLPNILEQMDYLSSNSDHFILNNAIFGDWLNMDQPTNGKYLATAYFAGMAKLVARMARLAGQEEDAARMDSLHCQVKAAFRKKFYTEDGNILITESAKTIDGREMLLSCTQTAALLALYFDLAPEHGVQKTLDWLVHDITVTKGLHLATGFLGTPLLLKVLTRYGRLDVAGKLLMQTTFPGWLYPVTQGATTMWERWNSWSDRDGFGDVGMNSFNHYAYGAVGDWFFETLGGINPLPEKSGTTPFRSFLLAPQFCREFEHVNTSFDAMSGKISSSWKRLGAGKVEWSFTVPCNTKAEVVPPGKLLSGEGLNRVGDHWEAEPGTYTLVIEEEK